MPEASFVRIAAASKRIEIAWLTSLRNAPSRRELKELSSGTAAAANMHVGSSKKPRELNEYSTRSVAKVASSESCLRRAATATVTVEELFGICDGGVMLEGGFGADNVSR